MIQTVREIVLQHYVKHNVMDIMLKNSIAEVIMDLHANVPYRKLYYNGKYLVM